MARSQKRVAIEGGTVGASSPVQVAPAPDVVVVGSKGSEQPPAVAEEVGSRPPIRPSEQNLVTIDP